MKNLIQLEDEQYEVRVVRGEREVKINGVWASTEDFVDYLSGRQEWSKLVILANYGKSVLSDNIKDNHE